MNCAAITVFYLEEYKQTQDKRNQYRRTAGKTGDSFGKPVSPQTSD